MRVSTKPAGNGVRKYIVEHGRHRLALWLQWRPWRYRPGIRRQAPGAYDGAFGFGVFTYLRKHH